MDAAIWRSWARAARGELAEAFDAQVQDLAAACADFPSSSMTVEDLGRGRRVLVVRIPVPDGAITVEDHASDRT